MSSTDRSTFLLLRPLCVRVTQAIARARSAPRGWRQLEDALHSLEDTLQGIGQLEGNIVDYLLFPILQSFQLDAQVIPSSVTTAALNCLSRVLAASGSRLSQPEFSSQILLLLINLLDRQGRLIVARRANEPEIASLCSCLQHLGSQGRFYYPSNHGVAQNPQVVVPGTLLAVLLEVVSSESVAAARMPALRVTQILVESASEPSHLRRFLPGLLSNLVKPFALIPNTRWSSKELVMSLTIVESSITRALQPTSNIQGAKNPAEEALQLEWLRNNGRNLESASRQLSKARDHPREAVRDSLFDLYYATLTACHSRLDTNLVRLLVDQILRVPAGESVSARHLKIRQLASSSEELRKLFMASGHSVIDLLPNELQAADSRRHADAFAAAGTSLTAILDIAGPDTGFASSATESLLSSAVVLMRGAAPSQTSVDVSVDLIAESGTKRADVDANIIFGTDFQTRSNIDSLRNLVVVVGQSRLGADLLETLSGSLEPGLESIEQLLPQFWISTVCIDLIPTLPAARDSTGASHVQLQNLLDVGYSAALDILKLSPLDERCDWRSQVLAMKLVTQRALVSMEAFRPELVYALYPIVERIACKNSMLQRNALEALKIISNACGYEDSSDLLLHNADYLINAVSIRLDTFDVRPETASVLQVAIKLCGAPFLPYVGDLTDSIFTVLDLYHGYPMLVQSMFSVLGTMIDQVPVADSQDHRVSFSPASLNESELVRKITEIGLLRNEGAWPDLNRFEDSDANADPSSEVVTTKKASEPLIARVLRQAQFYLTYESPSVRLGLLQILDTGFRALRHDQDVLLPVVNDLWPVVVLKLYDSEAYVTCQALQVLATLVECAGDFLSSRLEDEWPRLKSFLIQHKPNDRATISESSMASLRTVTQARTIWDAIVAFVGVCVGIITISPEMEDDFFDIFGQTDCLSEALSTLNSDALWLSQRLPSI